MVELDELVEDILSGVDDKICLTIREKEVLNLIVAGLTNKEIAKKLYRTERTIEYHRNHIMRKLDAHNAAELIRRSISLRLI